MATEPYIETRGAWVEFPIFDAKTRSLKKAFLGKAGGTIGRNSDNVVVIEALRDITLSLRMGDRVGLVGHNGAGKSTLLRLLSGIYEPTRGRTTVHGRVAPVFDLGVGMDPEITGYENIIIRGLFLGQTRKQMAAKVDEIAEFTELGEYLSMPLRTYSTGMRVRLAMGVVTSIDPEILLLDEGIGAVGVPDIRLFVRGDEYDVHRRLVRSGLPFGTCLDTVYLHPYGSDEFKPILGGRMHTQYPDDPVKRFFTYRNRGYVLAQPGLRRLLPQEWLRFGWYFLITRRDPAGLREWIRLRRMGRREQFGPPEPQPGDTR